MAIFYGVLRMFALLGFAILQHYFYTKAKHTINSNTLDVNEEQILTFTGIFCSNNNYVRTEQSNRSK